MIREVVYDKDDELYYLTKPRTNDKILDINVTPKSYDKSSFKLEVDKLEAHASVASAAKPVLRTSSNKEISELEHELDGFNPYSFNKDTMVKSVASAKSEAEKAMSASGAQIRRLEKHEEKIKNMITINAKINKLIIDRDEIKGKITGFKKLLTAPTTEKSILPKIEKKITELNIQVENLNAQIEALRISLNLKGGASRKKIKQRKQKHFNRKYTMKS
jgi:predicted  nucleic acid-binding Zn-ribbon protein